MAELINIEVYGIKEGRISNSNSEVQCDCSGDCDCDCSSTITAEEAYRQLASFLYNSSIKDKIETTFIDLIKEKTEKYDMIRELLERGFELPLVFINNEVKLYGSLFHDFIFDYVVEALENKDE